jgi:hypothetical protein
MNLKILKVIIFKEPDSTLKLSYKENIGYLLKKQRQLKNVDMMRLFWFSKATLSSLVFDINE